MKLSLRILLLSVYLFASSAIAQGMLVYDQQSATESFGGEAGFFIATNNQPFTQSGQSFIPTLASIDFIALQFLDGNLANTVGATVYVSLFSGSFTNGTLLGSTMPVFLPSGFGTGIGYQGFTNMFFQNTISLTPGTTYYLRPFIQTGDYSFFVMARTFGYSSGTSYNQGAPNSGFDLWFREGVVVVPEPSSLALSGLGGLLFLRAWQQRRSNA